MAAPMTDAWSRSQYDKAQDKLAEAIAILEEIYRDENTTFENRPIHWQRSKAGEAEQVRLLVMDNLIDELHDAVGTISAVEDDKSEPIITWHHASPPAATLKLKL
jgi:uncharacterized membrane protein YgaE (UPF0421/DUF939 family)